MRQFTESFHKFPTQVVNKTRVHEFLNIILFDVINVLICSRILTVGLWTSAKVCHKKSKLIKNI